MRDRPDEPVTRVGGFTAKEVFAQLMADDDVQMVVDEDGSVYFRSISGGEKLRKKLRREYEQWLIDLPIKFPWSLRFDDGEFREFAADLSMIRPFDTDSFDLCVKQWKDTADILADPELARRLSEPVTEDFGPVLPPERPVS